MAGTESGARWRRTATISAAAAALALVAASCGDSGEDEGGVTTITFSYLWTGPEAEALESLVAEFNASQEDILVEGVSSPDFQAQLTAMSSSSGSFDISDHFGNTVGAWAATGILEPLDGHLDATGIDTEDFIPAAMSQMSYQGAIYALPIATHSFQLLYNRELLADAGITEPPATMGAFAAAVQKLTKTDADGNIVQLGLGDPDTSTTLTTLGYAFGGQWDGADEPTPDHPGNIAALTWWQENVVKPYGADNLAAFVAGWGPYLSPQDPFYTGEVAMVIDGEWRARNIPDNAADLDWGVAPIPAASEELAGTTQLTASTLFIPANAEHKQEAAVFLKYLTDPDPMREFSLALGNLPGRTSLLDDPAYAEIPQFDVWLGALHSERTYALASRPYSQEYATDLAAAFDEITRDAVTPADAMKAVAEKSDSYATG